MKNEKIIHAFNTVQPDNEIKNRVFDKAMQKHSRKRPAFKTAASLAAAAVICLMVFGSMLPAAESENFFSVKAYALEQRDDGSIELREMDLMGDEQRWSYHFDGSSFYLNINLKCEGENINSVDFYTDDGFFAKQYLKTENGRIVLEPGVPAAGRTNRDGDIAVTMYGRDFEKIGNKFTLNKDEIADDLLLFLGKEIHVTDWKRVHEQFPSQMIIRAVATFNDGKTQEEIITLDLAAGEGSGSIVLPQEEIERRQAESAEYQELLHSIPLDQCEVMPDSLQILAYGDTFEYEHSDERFTGTVFHPITEDSMSSAMEQGLFDENGIFRTSSSLPDDGSDGYIAVIFRRDDGRYTGMVYRVPGWLIIESMSEGFALS